MSKTYNETRVNQKEVKVDANFQPVLDEKTGEQIFVENTNNQADSKSFLAKNAELKAHGLPDPEPTKVQTFQYTEVESPDELVPLLKVHNGELADDKLIELANSIINRGLVLAQQKAVRDFMLDEDQVALEGVYDLMQDVKPGEGRRKADPATKAIKVLSELLGRPYTQDELNRLLQIYAEQTAAQ